MVGDGDGDRGTLITRGRGRIASPRAGADPLPFLPMKGRARAGHGPLRGARERRAGLLCCSLNPLPPRALPPLQGSSDGELIRPPLAANPPRNRLSPRFINKATTAEPIQGGEENLLQSRSKDKQKKTRKTKTCHRKHWNDTWNHGSTTTPPRG